MKAKTLSGLMVALVATGLGVRPAYATFHLMQVEQVIGGVNCDTTVQAIQLRMRNIFQNFVFQARIRAWDAAGQNPILLIDFTSSVLNGNLGDRVLIASTNFADHTDPPAVPDFILSNLIPESYLAAGSLTFEDDFGTVWWRLSWGGAAYTGPGDVVSTSPPPLTLPGNDADGNANPPFSGPLPTCGDQALQFQGAASALSTNNADDYALSIGPAIFTNNAGFSFTVVLPPDCNGNDIPDPCDIACDTPGVPCDLPGCGESADCNNNGIPDDCDIASGNFQDIDGDGVLGECDVCGFTPPGTAVDLEGRPLGDIDKDCDTDLTDYALFVQGFTGP